jgi:hypothetical protein
MNPNALLIEQCKVILTTPPSLGNNAIYFSLKNYEKVTFVIGARNATTVTGSAITIKQATAIAGTGEKAISFTKAYRNLDLAVNQQLAEFTVSSDTFTLDTTNSKDLLYVVEIDLSQLDVKNGFDCVKLVPATSVAQTLSVTAILWPGKYDNFPGLTPLTD